MMLFDWQIGYTGPLQVGSLIVSIKDLSLPVPLIYAILLLNTVLIECRTTLGPVSVSLLACQTANLEAV